MDIYSGGTYKLMNTKSGTVLDLSRMGHTVVTGWKWHGGANQKWILQQHKNGFWTICNAADNRYLGIEGGLHKGGTPVIGVNEAVYWDIKPDAKKGAKYRIFVPGENLNLDLAGGGDSKSGTNVQIWEKWTPGENQTWILHEALRMRSLVSIRIGIIVTGYRWHGGANQRWTLKQHKNNLWTICNTADKKYLGIQGGLYKDGTSVVGMTDPVYWDIKRDTKDRAKYRIFVPGTGFNLDLAGGGDSKPGTNIQIWGKWTPGVNQMWKLREDALVCLKGSLQVPLY
ncbi:hypothetical protein Clacol_004127 [Clathrus columnatus]|uniref:Ricin B lectin domain-containing protein n=1 Tax=Clathrus columnatus TaxID=1419009 RepID=A0AAV5A8W5_9AGAM|nr:hypothetical protein Clacol_004127 [Clathrus columnatus]